MRASIIAAVVAAFIGIVAQSASSQQPGTVMAVEADTYACRTSNAIHRLQVQVVGQPSTARQDLAAALANGQCLHLPRGQAVRVLDARPGVMDSLVGAPRRVELLAVPNSGQWYIEFDAIGIEYKAPPAPAAEAVRTYYALSDLMPLAQRFLADAGITDYKFLPLDAGSLNNLLTWQYSDGTLASLVITRPEAKIDVSAVLADTVKSAASYCKGQYSSGFMPARYYLGSEIRKAFTACADGAKSFANYFSILVLPTGAIVRIGTSGDASGQPGATIDAIPRTERLENAALISRSK